MEIALGLLSCFCFAFVALLLSLILPGLMAPKRKARDFERRQGLIGQVNLLAGPGAYAFSADYSRVLFVNQAGDLLVVGEWKGSRPTTTPLHPHEIMRARLAAGPMESQAYGVGLHQPLPQTCVIIERPGKPVISMVMGDEQTAAQWVHFANSVAARYHAGHGTMRVN